MGFFLFVLIFLTETNPSFARVRGAFSEFVPVHHDRFDQTLPSPPQRKDRVSVVIAPHPDDEILCCSGRIKKLLQSGKNVKIIYITNGDRLEIGDFQTSRLYGQKRRRESVQATHALGLLPSDLYFLNFPDGHLHQLKKNIPFQSLYTGQRMTDDRSAFPQTPYTQDGLRSNLQSLFVSWIIEEVYIPSASLDTHKDHRFTAQIVREAFADMHLFPKIFEYVVHNATLKKDTNVSHNSFKLSLIHFFTSQFWTPSHRHFMESFAQKPESFISSPYENNLFGSRQKLSTCSTGG